jgi:hypothetical protein
MSLELVADGSGRTFDGDGSSDVQLNAVNINAVNINAVNIDVSA